jgi:hypothetical protein
MRLFTRIRAVIAALALVMHAPTGGEFGHLGISLFIGRFTRVAAAQQFDITRPAPQRKLVLAQVAALELQSLILEDRHGGLHA